MMFGVFVLGLGVLFCFVLPVFFLKTRTHKILQQISCLGGKRICYQSFFFFFFSLNFLFPPLFYFIFTMYSCLFLCPGGKLKPSGCLR